MNRVHYSHCPVCRSRSVNPLLTVKDHSVSGEDFVLWQCATCSLRFTQDAPDADSIGPYYAAPHYISHSNSNRGLLDRLYHRVRRFTLQQKARLITSHTQPKGRLLDIGAGIGAFLSVMKEQGWTVTGVEPDEGARSKAQSLFGLALQTPDAIAGLPNGGFDAVTLWHVLEHVHDLHETMDGIVRVLAPGGKVFIAVPNYNALDAEAYRTWWAAYDVPRHLYHFTPAAMQTLLTGHGLQLVEKKPMWFDAFYISLLSSRYRQGRTGWVGAGYNGLRSNLAALVNRDRCSSLVYVAAKAQS